MTDERDKGAWRFSFTVRDGEASDHQLDWDASAEPLTAEQRQQLAEILFAPAEDTQRSSTR